MNEKITTSEDNVFNRVVMFVSGLGMIVGPLAQMIAFAIHPQFWTFKYETGADIQYGYIQNIGWQVGHILVYVTLPLLLLAWMQVAKLVSKTRPWFAIVGGALSWVGLGFMIGAFGAVMVQGTLGLNLPQEQAVPAIQVMLKNIGMMKITFMGEIAALLGPVILLIGALLSPRSAMPKWAAGLALVGNLIIAAALDIDAIMIWGAFAILIGLSPLALKLMKGQELTTA